MKLLRLFTLLTMGMVFAIANSQTVHMVAAGDSTLEAAFRDAASGDIIELTTDGGLYTNSRLFVNKDITIRAAVGLEVKPILQNIDSVEFNYLFKINGMATLVLDGLDLDGDGTGNGAESILFNIIAIQTDDSLSAVQLKINNCDLHDTKDKLIKPYGQSGIDSLIITNSTFFNAAKEGVTLFSGSASDPPVYLDYAEFYNCTFHSIVREAIKADAYSDLKLVVDHCTFYDVGNGTKGHIYVSVATDVTIKNSVFQKCEFDGNFIRLGSDANRVNNIIAWDMVSYDIDNSISVTDTLNADPLFADTASFDFTLGASSPAYNFADDGKPAGDLRWAPNLAPTTFVLLQPLNGDTLESLTDPVNFTWNQSKDSNGDPIIYTLNISGGVKLDTTFTALTDTTFIFNGDGILESTSVYNWHVLASDGEFMTSSADTFSFETPNVAPSTFALLQPSDGDTLTSLTDPVNFTWNQSKDSFGDTIIYTLNISGGVDLDTTITALTDTTFIFNGDGIFERTSVYNWHVLASDGEFTTSSADTFKFETLNVAPPSFALLQPLDGDTLTSSIDPVNFTWNPSKDSNGDPIIYTLNISGGVDLDTTITALTDTTFIFNGDGIFENSSVYSWHVLASDGEFTTSSADTFSFETPNVASSSFSLLQPSDGDTLTTMTDPVNFIWNESKDSGGNPIIYTLNISGGVDLDTSITALTDTIFNFNGDGIFENSSVYNWYVLASDGEFTTSSADTFSFVTPNVAPSSFALLLPLDGDTLTSLTDPVNFTWNESIDSSVDPIIYTINISGGADLDTTITALTDTTFIFNGDGIFENSSVYSWHVLASDGEFSTSSTDTFSFVTPAPTGIYDGLNGMPTDFDLKQNYPNPFNPSTTIKYQLPKSTHVKLVIFNILGQKVMTLINRQQNAGYKTAVWDGKNISGQQVPSGMYLYRIETAEYSKTMKMLMIK